MFSATWPKEVLTYLLTYLLRTLMFSATWPKEVRALASDFQVDPVRITTGVVDKLNANKDITQHVQLHENSMSKLEALSTLVQAKDVEVGRERVCHTVVFVNRKRDADMVAADLRDHANIRAAALHGDLPQSRRDSVLNGIKSGRAQVPLACMHARARACMHTTLWHMRVARMSPHGVDVERGRAQVLVATGVARPMTRPPPPLCSP